MTRRSNMSKFEELYNLNVNGKTEQKNGLTYLSWAWAWAEFKKVYPEATYEVVKFDGLPYAYDTNTGYMVYTKVTADGITHEMWLPVMDGANHAMKSERYEIQTKYKKIPVEPATMFDVNKTIMRCLTKNLAMFGLGLYIYAGEDLPETETPEAKAPEPVKCPKCGKVITPIKKQDGSIAQPADILKGCGGMCYDCYQKKA
jgi:hypothetical protein